jgi:ATP-dependent Clp protease ATP-binding subunit ClpC
VELEVSEEAVRHVAAKGHDPRYGARPLKRAMEREVLVPLADAINQYAEGTRLEARVDAVGAKLSVQVRAKTTEGGGVARTLASESNYAVVVDAIRRLRRKMQLLLKSPSILGIRNELYQIQRMLAHAEAKRDEVGKATHRQRMKRPAELLGEVDALTEEVTALEDAAMAALYEDAAAVQALTPAVDPLYARWEALLLRVYAHGFPDADRTLIGVYGEAADRWRMLTRAYVEAAKRWEYRVHLWWFGRHGADEYLRHECRDIDEFFDKPQAGILGVAMSIEGTYAALRFVPEKGVHLFTEGEKNRSDPCLVDASELAIGKYVPPAGVEKRRGIPAGPIRRAYDIDRGEMEDPALGFGFQRSFDPRDLARELVDVMEAQLRAAARRIIES